MNETDKYEHELLRADLGAVRSEYLAERQLSFVSSWLLHSSWLSFGLAVASTVLALFFSHLAFKNDIVRVDSNYAANCRRTLEFYGLAETAHTPVDEPTHRWNNRSAQATRHLSMTAIAFFLLGVVFLVSFGWANLGSLGERMPKASSTNESGTSSMPVDGADTRVRSDTPAGSPAPPVLVRPPESSSSGGSQGGSGAAEGGSGGEGAGGGEGGAEGTGEDSSSG